MDYLDYSDLRNVRNCIMTNVESKKNIEITCLDDPNEINFLPKMWFTMFLFYGLNAIWIW
jgi:hypothetical protein